MDRARSSNRSIQKVVSVSTWLARGPLWALLPLAKLFEEIEIDQRRALPLKMIEQIAAGFYGRRRQPQNNVAEAFMGPFLCCQNGICGITHGQRL